VRACRRGGNLFDHEVKKKEDEGQQNYKSQVLTRNIGWPLDIWGLFPGENGEKPNVPRGPGGQVNREKTFNGRKRWGLTQENPPI